MKHLHLVIIGLSILSGSVYAQWPSAEHLLYVRIETEPSASKITTVPSKEGESPVVLGQSPLVIPIELNWDRSYLRKKWEKIHVTSRAGITTNTFDPADKTHTITLAFGIEKAGYARQEIHQIAAVLQYDERASDWDHAIDALPENRVLSYTLKPLSSSPYSAGTAGTEGLDRSSTNNSLSTVIFARGADTDASKVGYLLVSTPAGAPILVDEKPAGNAPLRIILSGGKYTISTLKNGKPSSARTVTIEAGKTSSVSLDFEK